MSQRPMSDEEIAAHVDNEIRNSIGYTSGELASQRKLALEYYYGEPFGNEVEGRSSYVSRDVADTIEWIMPSLMKIFMGGDTVVRFEPQGPEDELSSSQATDYINYIFNRQNDGFLTLYTWFKDALLSKNGFVKVYYEEYDDYKTEILYGLTDDQFVMLAQDENVEVLEHTAYPDPSVPPLNAAEGVMMQPQTLHDAKLRTKNKSGKCCVVPVPPEEILVNRYAVAPLNKNRFICHRRRISLSELREMGYDNVDDLASGDEEDWNEERITRFGFDETSGTADDHLDPASRMVWIEESLINLDVDRDGIAERRKIIKVGKRILSNDEDETTRIVTLTPIILPHKLFGMSVADLVMDLQLLKSTVFRQILDNMYLANNGRYMALEGMVNIDDLLTSRPGGIVRVKTFDAVKPMQPPLLGAPAFNLLEYIDQIKESRTGVSRSGQGLNADILSKTGSNGIESILSAAQQRTELIARVFAETGVKDLFYAILECVQKHQKKSQVIRLRNQWVEMDPREWSNKFDMTVTVGLGTGSKEVLAAALMKTLELQFGAMQSGIPIVQPTNVYHLAQELLKAFGIKGGDMFFTRPDQMPPQPNPAEAEMARVQAEGQVELQKQSLKNQGAIQKTLIQAQVKQGQQQSTQAHDMQKHSMTLGAQMRTDAMSVAAEDRMNQREIMADMMQHSQEIANGVGRGARPSGESSSDSR